MSVRQPKLNVSADFEPNWASLYQKAGRDLWREAVSSTAVVVAGGVLCGISANTILPLISPRLYRLIFERYTGISMLLVCLLCISSIVLLIRFSRSSATQRTTAAAKFNSRQLALLGVSDSSATTNGNNNSDSNNNNVGKFGLKQRQVPTPSSSDKIVHGGLVGFTTPSKRVDRWSRRDSPLSTGGGTSSLSGMRARRLGLEDSAGRVVESKAGLHAAMAMSPNFSRQDQQQQRQHQQQQHQTPTPGRPMSVCGAPGSAASRVGNMKIGNGGTNSPVRWNTSRSPTMSMTSPINATPAPQSQQRLQQYQQQQQYQRPSWQQARSARLRTPVTPVSTNNTNISASPAESTAGWFAFNNQAFKSHIPPSHCDDVYDGLAALRTPKDAAADEQAYKLLHSLRFIPPSAGGNGATDDRIGISSDTNTNNNNNSPGRDMNAGNARPNSNGGGGGVNSISKNGCVVAEVMDEWTESLKRAVLRHVRDVVVQPFEADLAQLVLIRDSRGVPLFSPEVLQYKPFRPSPAPATTNNPTPVVQPQQPPQQSAFGSTTNSFGLGFGAQPAAAVATPAPPASLDPPSTFAASLLAADQLVRSMPTQAARDQATQHINLLLMQRKKFEKYFEMQRPKNKNAFAKGAILRRLREWAAGEDLELSFVSRKRRKPRRSQGDQFSSPSSLGGRNTGHNASGIGGGQFRKQTRTGEDAANGNNDGGDESTWEEPTDSELLVHVVCVWLDESLRVDTSQQSFEKIHLRSLDDNVEQLCADQWWGILDCGERLDASTSSVVAGAGVGVGGGSGMLRFNDQFGIHLSPGARMRSGGVYLSHYKVVVQGVVWEVRGGRGNALQAVALFLYSMYTHGVGKDVQFMEQVILSANRTYALRRAGAGGGGGSASKAVQ